MLVVWGIDLYGSMRQLLKSISNQRDPIFPLYAFIIVVYLNVFSILSYVRDIVFLNQVALSPSNAKNQVIQ